MPVLRNEQPTEQYRSVYVYCPGCGIWHRIPLLDPDPNMHTWEFNEDFDNPTLNPSVLIRYPNAAKTACHFFIRDGMIEYCNDSDHAYAGRRVSMMEIDGDIQTYIDTIR